jgi:hypothetical protein
MRAMCVNYFLARPELGEPERGVRALEVGYVGELLHRGAVGLPDRRRGCVRRNEGFGGWPRYCNRKALTGTDAVLQRGKLCDATITLISKFAKKLFEIIDTAGTQRTQLQRTNLRRPNIQLT